MQPAVLHACCTRASSRAGPEPPYFDDSQSQSLKCFRILIYNTKSVFFPEMYRPDRAKALLLLKDRRDDMTHGRNALSYRQISNITHIPKSDLFFWDHQDMSPQAQNLRAEAHAWNRFLIFECRYEVGGFIIYRNITLRDTSTETIQEYIWRRFGFRAHPSYVSGLRMFCHLTKKKVIKVLRGRLSHSLIESAIHKLEEFRKLDISPENIVCVDKIYFSDTPTKSIQTGMQGMYVLKHLLAWPIRLF